MNGAQFEELCRFFIARVLEIRIERVSSVRMEARRRSGEAPGALQVDLCWETDTRLGRYLNIAEAKWRTREKIEQDTVYQLEQLRQEVGAQKAMLISNAKCTSGALAAAKRLNIAVHRLTPNFSTDGMPVRDRKAMQKWLEAEHCRRKELYSHEIKGKARDISDVKIGPTIPGARVG